ncbi:hypothetical protein CHS0354_004160 [Potamilus streckersoni]|uniref:ADP-ribosylation factor-like protein 2-binding protein n=1 Tax=Potamilus streckersoni TaxID=2493646 RepID=A0AAE0T0G0_9BIVA|nr:hypothetical protein CHS0354_004160 [Potamilus streckersoni]
MASNLDTENENDSDDEIEPMDFAFHEEELAVSRSSVSDTKFDVTIGHIEDIIMEEEFQTAQNEFLEKYYHEFEDTEENKFIYTDLHREYVSLIEKYLNEELCKRMPDFDMGEFTKQLMARKNELEGEIFEMMLTFSDFLAFKQMFLDFRAEKEGRTIDLSSGITVTRFGGSDLSLDGSSLSLTGRSLGKY